MNPSQEQPAARPSRDRPSWNSLSGLRREWPLVASFTTAALFLEFGPHWLADLSNAFWLTFLVAWLFAVILLSAFAMVRHGEGLAVKLGEPRGTLIMTLAATGIEVIRIYQGPERYPGPRRGRHDPSPVDIGAQYAHIRQRPDQRLAWRSAPPVVPRVPDAHV
jgi:hypothetical protein